MADEGTFIIVAGTLTWAGPKQGWVTGDEIPWQTYGHLRSAIRAAKKLDPKVFAVLLGSVTPVEVHDGPTDKVLWSSH